ncbi:uncharacterized protein si:rp71-46j2.7 [Silurus meridionalis]|uniref:PXA domain-containing protein n=1 Tax=Silurus meridionalis TaxID=175797 RepID=A0A8T0BPG6_SILME|nr:uncharacterized protein si:rp71-46j2.7 [Silurus meridionalis]KAF7707306.1 hypothetical protein HF521_018524 [Silurus meridionalis]
MYLWRCVFAVVFGLVWYFSEFGCFLVQVGCCALCLSLFTLGQCNNVKCESSSQTDCAPDDDVSQQEFATGHLLGSDEPDTAVQTVEKAAHHSQYPNIQRSIQHMFNCAYNELVLPWSTSPELGDSHPLRAALLTEFNFVMHEIICKAKDMDLPHITLGCIQLISQHLHNTKQTDGSPAFSSIAKEIAVIRGFCEALIHNLLPKHLWETKVYYCVLQEILVTKAMALVEMLSNPDSLNQLIISRLEQMPSKNEMKGVHVPDKDIPFSENSDVVPAETEEHLSKGIKAKKKGNKLKQGFSKMFEGIRHKRFKKKKVEKDIIEIPIRHPASIECDSENNKDDSSFDSHDVESLTCSIQEKRMEFKLTYEMWRVGEWSVTVTSVQMEENELCFIIHLEESDDPENLHWDVKKNQSNIKQFYDQFKEIGELPSLLTIVEKPNNEWNKEETRGILEKSLQELVKKSKLGKSELVFNFLGPINWILHEEEHEGGMWDLLERIAFFLAPSKDDDEVSNFKEDETQHEDTHEPTPQSDLDTTISVCAASIEEQDKENEDGSLEEDGEPSHTPEQNSTDESAKQHADKMCVVSHVWDQPEVTPVEIQSVAVNIAQYAKMNYPKFKLNVKEQASSPSSSESDEESSGHCTNDAVSGCKYNGNKSKENLCHRKSKETDKPKRKEIVSHPEEETSSQPEGETKMPNDSKEPEASKVIFDLLKELSGNSYTIKFMKAVVTPFTPLINKKVKAFLKKINPSEAQIAIYIDGLCNNIWPDGDVPQPRIQSSDKNETKQKALQLMTEKFAGFAINKANVESNFKIFQNEEENKKLVYMLLIYLLRKFLPGEPCFNVMSKLNVKPTI